MSADLDSADGLAAFLISISVEPPAALTSRQPACTSLGTLLVQSEDRLALLAWLKAHGVKILSDRQRIANELSKMRRARETTVVAPAAPAPVVDAPALLAASYSERHPCGTHGLLIRADGKHAHVNSSPPPRVDDGSHQWITHGTRLDGPVIGEVARLAALLGRPARLRALLKPCLLYTSPSPRDS